MSALFFVFLILNTPIIKIDFVGNHSIAGKELRSVILSKNKEDFNELNLTYDVNRIIRFYNSKGFFETKVTTTTNASPAGIEVIFSIQEGYRPKIKKIIISLQDTVQNNEEEKIKDLFEVDINDHFIENKIRNSEVKIGDYYKDNGYAFADISSSIIPDSGFLSFNIEKGTLYYIREINLKGLKITNSRVILREIELKKGDRFSKSKLQNSQRRIYGLGFFGTINIELFAEKSDSIDLIFTIRELKSRVLNFGVGLSIPLSFLLSFGIEELNLFNYGHRFQIRPLFKIGLHREWETKFEARYTIPYLTPAKLILSVLPFYWLENKPEFLRRTKGYELKLSKIYNENIQYNIANQYKFVDFLRTTLPDTSEGVTNSLRLQFMFDYRDEFFNPKNGVYLVPLFEYAGGLFGGANNFIRLEIEERFFIPVLKNIVGQRFKFGIMVPTDGLAIGEKYYLGGQYSLRGYPEKSLGPDSLANEKYGNIMANINLEYRVALLKNFGFVTFFDAGYVANEIDFKHKDFLKTSMGFGLRYNTPIGPVRADLGFPLMKRGAEFYLGIYHIF